MTGTFDGCFWLPDHCLSIVRMLFVTSMAVRVCVVYACVFTGRCIRLEMVGDLGVFVSLSIILMPMT